MNICLPLQGLVFRVLAGEEPDDAVPDAAQLALDETLGALLDLGDIFEALAARQRAGSRKRNPE